MAARLATTVVAALALALASCDVLLVNSEYEACVPAARDYGGPIVGAFHTTVGDIQQLLPGDPPTLWPERSPADRAVLCYIDAYLPHGPAPGPNGEIPRLFDRVVVGVVDGAWTMVKAGYRTDLPILPP